MTDQERCENRPCVQQTQPTQAAGPTSGYTPPPTHKQFRLWGTSTTPGDLRGAWNILGTAFCSEWISRKSLFLSARVPCIWHSDGFDGVSCSSLHTGNGRGIQVRGTCLKPIVLPVRGCAGEPSWGLSLLSVPPCTMTLGLPGNYILILSLWPKPLPPWPACF